jgi:hypothetical protein
VPWAAAGVLKNLAISERAAEPILEHEQARECLCRMARSGDWLESSKASAALTYLQPRASLRVGHAFLCDGASRVYEPRRPASQGKEEL